MIRIVEEVESLAAISAQLFYIREPEALKRDFRSELEELKSRGYDEKLVSERYAEFESEYGVIRKKIIHGRKLEPIYGADVVVEFPDDKVVFIQRKQIRNRRFVIERGQLLTLLKLCQELCACVRCGLCTFFILRLNFCPSHPKCGATYYALDFGNEVRYIRACDLNFVLGIRKSVGEREIKPATILEDLFRDLLLKKEIGCKDIPKREKENIFKLYCTVTNRIIFLLEPQW